MGANRLVDAEDVGGAKRVMARLGFEGDAVMAGVEGEDEVARAKGEDDAAELGKPDGLAIGVVLVGGSMVIREKSEARFSSFSFRTATRANFFLLLSPPLARLAEYCLHGGIRSPDAPQKLRARRH